MRTALITFGVFGIGIGLLWFAQRGVWMPWPPSRFGTMDVRTLWFGIIPILGGFTLLALTRRL